MKKNLSFSAIIIMLLISACSKPEGAEGDDLSGENELTGQVVLKDTLRGVSAEVTLKDHLVQLKTPEQNDNEKFLFDRKTNAQGNFTFTNIASKEYLLRSRITIDSIEYLADTIVHGNTKDAIKMTLYPSAKTYNVLSLIVRDSSTREFLPGADVCLFTSKAQADSANCGDAIRTGKADEAGRILFHHLAAGTYYVNAVAVIGGITLKKILPVTIDATGIMQDVVDLAPEGRFIMSGAVYFNDTLTGISSEVALQNQVVLIKKARDSLTTKFIHQLSTNNFGGFSTPSLPPGIYVAESSKQENGITYFTRAVFDGSQNDLKLVLYPYAEQYNVVQFITIDEASMGLLNNAQVCVINSRQVADLDTCINAIKSPVTNSNGRAFIDHVPPGRYYLNVRYEAGDLLLTAKDSVDVPANGIIYKTLHLK